jgi:CHAT domain-containing protein/Tfp pilus assembly protein PilF
VLLKVILAAAFAAIIVGTASTAPAQDEASELNKKLIELYDAGRDSDAIPIGQRLLAIREQTLGPDHPNVGVTLAYLGLLYQRQGRNAEAEPLLQRALRINERSRGPDDPDVARSLINLAELYKNQGRYADAEAMYRRSLSIREKTLGPNHLDFAESLNDLALLFRHQGRYADAEAIYHRSLAIYEKALGPDHLYVATSLNNLGVLFKYEQRYAEAEPLTKRALAIREKALGPDHADVGETLNNLATMYDDQERYAEAEPLFQRSLAIREKALGGNHPFVAESLNNLGSMYSSQGRYADAERLHQRALVIREKALGSNHPEVAFSLHQLGWLKRHQGRYAEAERLIKRALAIREKALGSDHPYVALTLNEMANIYQMQGRYGDALSIIRRTMSQGTMDKTIALRVILGTQKKRLISSAQAFADSYDVVQRATSTAAASAISKLAARFSAGNDELAQLVRRDQDSIAEAEALDKTVIAFVSSPPAQRSAEAEQQVRKRIDEVKAEHERLQQIFNERFPDYVALSKAQPVSLAETQALLAEDEALLVFDFDAKSYALIVTRDGADWTELKIAARDLDEQVRSLRAWIADPRKRFDPALAYRIYQETFGAFADKIAAKQRLSIVTNGALTSLPPQLLVTKDPTGKTLKEMDWLIRSHAVTILPSVASLKILRAGSQTSSARKPMIAFADPVFSKAARAQQVAMRSITSFYRGTQVDAAAIGEYLPQLPGTRREAQQIAEDLTADPADIKLGLAATETAVKQAKLDQYRIVYFATHGLVAGDLETFAKDKAEPALALSIPEKPNDLDDGLLTASEIAQLKLDADWAVLSACNTAAEDKPGAEALSGLARAFFYAGARSLIVSHWAVSDEATARLMIGTFRASARDPRLSHAEALRQSILAMIDAAKSDAEADPRLWAPFVVVGEPAKTQ